MSKPKKIARTHIETPWTAEQIADLNFCQTSGCSHPYTCGFDRKDKKHLDGEGILIATENGWICSYCDYKQTWAMDYSVLINETKAS